MIILFSSWIIEDSEINALRITIFEIYDITITTIECKLLQKIGKIYFNC